MFSIDERLRGLPANREQVLALFQSINSPYLAIPGKQAGVAQAFILGLRGASSFAVLIYLYLSESQDCAVYSSGQRTTTPEAYQAEESDALAFVESMGFMMDNLNFRQLPVERQDEMLHTLPLFFKDPRMIPSPGGAKKAESTPATPLGRLLASF